MTKTLLKTKHVNIKATKTKPTLKVAIIWLIIISFIVWLIIK